MTIFDVISGLRAQLVNDLGPGIPVFVQNQHLDTTNNQKYLNLIVDIIPSYCGAGGDILREYTVIIEVYYKSDADVTGDSAIQFDQFVDDVLNSLQTRDHLDELQQRKSLKLHKGITDIRNYPFANSEPGLFKKIITLRGYVHNT